MNELSLLDISILFLIFFFFSNAFIFCFETPFFSIVHFYRS